MVNREWDAENADTDGHREDEEEERKDTRFAQVPREKRVEFKKIIGTIIPKFSFMDAWRGGYIDLYWRLMSKV